jgi:hypothetical protein
VARAPRADSDPFGLKFKADLKNRPRGIGRIVGNTAGTLALVAGAGLVTWTAYTLYETIKQSVKPNENNHTRRGFEDLEGRANDEEVERAPGHDLDK